MSLFRRFFGKHKEAPADAGVKETREMRITRAALEAASKPTDSSEQRQAIAPYEPPDGVIPGGREGKNAAMAMDSTPYDYLNLYGFTGAFPGYPYLADLSQRPEYRKMSGIIAEEMVRKWIEIKAKGDDDKADKIKRLEDAMERFRVRQLFREAAENDGYFGRGQLYFEVKTPSGAIASEDPDELAQPLFLDKAKIKKGSLVEIRSVEPVWTYPGAYQATNPLKKDYYKPQKWFVMGDTVHVSRFAMFVSRPVSDMLKPAYNFGGLSLSQIAEPYVNNWLRTRNSVGDLVHSFSLSILYTDMESILAGGSGQSLFDRIDLFNRVRDNRGAMAADKDSEEIEQINTPLTGLHELQAQSQEHMCSVSSIPLVKFTGITPSGLNASSEGEIRVFYDHIHSQQEATFRENLEKTLDILQLHEFGEIDPDITFEFVSLHELTEKEESEIEKNRADTHQKYIDMGAVDPDEVRQAISNDPDSPYAGLELSDEAPGVAEEDEDAPPNPA